MSFEVVKWEQPGRYKEDLLPFNKNALTKRLKALSSLFGTMNREGFTLRIMFLTNLGCFIWTAVNINTILHITREQKLITTLI